MSSYPEHNEREEWVDILRGIAVFMVILGHLYKGYYYHLSVNPLKMPMFYFLAGYVTKFNKPIKNAVLTRARTLFIPMLVFSLFPVRALYYLIVLKDMEVFANYIKGFATGSINWFIYSFFVSSIMFALIGKLTKGNKYLFGIICAILFAIGILTKDIPAMDLWCVNTALTGLLFMYIGYIVKETNSKYLDKLWISIICVSCYASLLWLSTIYYNGKAINYHLCEYYSIPICMILIVSGIYFSRYITKKCCEKTKNRVKDFFVSFGQNTIVVYLASSTFNSVVLVAFRKLLHTSEPSFIYCVIGAIFSCTFGFFVSVICRKYAPFLLGIKR